jgi:enamine deaminase RidA (YjgF/YER057c/UK114 family)
MQRSDINPWEWSKPFGFSQAIDLRDAGQLLVCSGQTAIGPDGSPPTTDDMAEQITIALDNLQTVLAAAGLSFADVVNLTLYTTDMDAFLGSFRHVAAPKFGDNLPASTLIGVTRLAFPQLKVEIEALAAR